MAVIFKASGAVEAADAEMIIPRRTNIKAQGKAMVTHMQLMR